jgi:hypothetical protein
MSAFDPKILQKGMATYKWAKDGKMSDAQFLAGIKALASFGIFKQPSDKVISEAYTTAYQS